jgi:hypothetical protein
LGCRYRIIQSVEKAKKRVPISKWAFCARFVE